VFQQAQDAERDRVYFDPAVQLAKSDGRSTLGQFGNFDLTTPLNWQVYGQNFSIG
jgi:hypothetical protein